MIETLLNQYGFRVCKRDTANNHTYFLHSYIKADNKIAGTCNKIRVTQTNFSTYKFVMGSWEVWQRVSATLTAPDSIYLYRPILFPVWWEAQQTLELSELENYLEQHYQIV